LLPLHERYVQGFEYSDCWADDARLVVINAIDAPPGVLHRTWLGLLRPRAAKLICGT